MLKVVAALQGEYWVASGKIVVLVSLLDPGNEFIQFLGSAACNTGLAPGTDPGHVNAAIVAWAKAQAISLIPTSFAAGDTVLVIRPYTSTSFVAV